MTWLFHAVLKSVPTGMSFAATRILTGFDASTARCSAPLAYLTSPNAEPIATSAATIRIETRFMTVLPLARVLARAVVEVDRRGRARLRRRTVRRRFGSAAAVARWLP